MYIFSASHPNPIDLKVYKYIWNTLTKHFISEFKIMLKDYLKLPCSFVGHLSKIVTQGILK